MRHNLTQCSGKWGFADSGVPRIQFLYALLWKCVASWELGCKITKTQTLKAIMSAGKSIRIYLSDVSTGNTTGIRHVELVNWTGQAVVCPRSRLPELGKWQEAQRPGVYFLFEGRFGDAKQTAYTGEAENVVKRLVDHDRKKEFWNEVVIFTSKDENLTKAHVKFLEANLVALARTADRYELENGQTPTEASLPRADKDAMVEFTVNLRLVLGALGYSLLEGLLKPADEKQTDTAQASTQDILDQSGTFVLKVNNLVANGIVTDEGFVLKKGSQVSLTNSDSMPKKVQQIKDQLNTDGRLSKHSDSYVLEEDILCSSSSNAAALVAGTSRSGPQSWIAADGRTLKMVEDSLVEVM